MIWHRIDKTDVSIHEVSTATVRDRARAISAQDARHLMADGRFNTPFAMYVREDQLTDSERALPVRLILR